ncbi:unnamed protein product [Ixodes hexagonus]
MKTGKLKRHLEAIHVELLVKNRDFFIRKMSELRGQQKTFVERAYIPPKTLSASYKVAHMIAQSKKPHTVGEELINTSSCHRYRISNAWRVQRGTNPERSPVG